MIPPPPRSTLFPYTTLFRSEIYPKPNPIPPITPEPSHSIQIWCKTTPRADISSPPDHNIAEINPTLRGPTFSNQPPRSEEHTSELQSRPHLVCRLLLEKKKN